MSGTITLRCENSDEVLHALDVTYNLSPMLDRANLLEVLFAEGAGSLMAFQLVGPLQRGLTGMINEPAEYEALDPQNGWGSFEVFMSDLLGLFLACRRHPNAVVKIS